MRIEPDRLPPEMMITGTPRSGTTLVQRLVTDWLGVPVPPETHFFASFYRGLIRRSRFPMDQPTISRELEEFSNLPTSRELEFDHSRVIELLNGRCLKPAHLFGAITRVLAGSPEVVGEKTPDHLRWWKPLHAGYPSVKFIFVTRDPRGVVASRVRAGWGASIPELLAARWRADQWEILRALDYLPESRRLLLRYEELVQNPQVARAQIIEFAGERFEGSELEGSESYRLFSSWETWKERALKPVTASRVEAWREVLTPSQAAYVLNSCRTEMMRLGYPPVPDPSRAEVALPLDLKVRIYRMRFSRWRERNWIGRRRL